MTNSRSPRTHERWARLRFSVIGQLLAAPPAKGELRAAIVALAARQWCHPDTGEAVSFGFSTIQRWFYIALRERNDPVGKLRRKRRADAGRERVMSDAVRQAALSHTPPTRAGAPGFTTTIWSRSVRRDPNCGRCRPIPRCAAFSRAKVSTKGAG